MKLFGIIFFALLMSCSKHSDYSGNWELELKLQDQILPAIIKLEQKKNIVTGELINSKESLSLVGKIKNDILTMSIGPHYSEFNFQLKNGMLDGLWVRTNKDDFKVKISGKKTSNLDLFKKYIQIDNLNNVNGEWKIQLDEKTFGLGQFKQVGSRVSGSILTETGDYRYLDGYIVNNEIKLYGFDGVFSFVINLNIIDSKLVGKMYSGTTFNQEIEGVRDSSFKLRDANEMTVATAKVVKNFEQIDIFNKKVSFNDDEYKNKIKIIQLFGSWCPNCIDETNFFVRWRKENISKLNHIAFIALSFEKTDSKQVAIKNLKKSVDKLQMDYPVILVDFNKTVEVSSILPIEKVLAYPTTIFLNHKNEIVKIHTGFSGQATDGHFEQFENEFNETISTLLSGLN